MGHSPKVLCFEVPGFQSQFIQITICFPIAFLEIFRFTKIIPLIKVFYFKYFSFLREFKGTWLAGITEEKFTAILSLLIDEFWDLNKNALG